MDKIFAQKKIKKTENRNEEEEQERTSESRQNRRVKNRCPGCGYDMGFAWASQYCSRRCMYSHCQ